MNRGLWMSKVRVRGLTSSHLSSTFVLAGAALPMASPPPGVALLAHHGTQASRSERVLARALVVEQVAHQPSDERALLEAPLLAVCVEAVKLLVWQQNGDLLGHHRTP